MTSLVCAAIFFGLLHSGVAGTRLRSVIVGRVGEQGYLGLFSAATFVAIIWLTTAYSAAPLEVLWGPPTWMRWLALPVTLAAGLLAVLGLTTPNPGVVGGDRTLDEPDVVRGILRVTRHPFLWGVALWAAMHLALNGDAASIVLFTTFLIVALNGTRSIDRKRRERLGRDWIRYEGATSNLPGAALFTGRTHFVASEIGLGFLGLAVVVYVVLLLLHPLLFGVVPWP